MANKFSLNNKGEYFQSGGVQVMSFSDFYPAGHQSGISIIMNGKRVATNGDIRFEPTPGQWQPVPCQKKRTVDKDNEVIVTNLSYPDKKAHLKGFNPIIYPDYEFDYSVSLRPCGDSLIVIASLDNPIPEKYVGKLCFNLELYPTELFGKPWIMDDKQGVFPRHPNGPVFERESNFKNAGHFADTDEHVSPEQLAGDNKEYSPIVADDILGVPYAAGHRFTVRPEDELSRFTVESDVNELKLYDGRMNHNNGWFVLSSEIPAGATKDAIVWKITPNVDENWIYPPVVQVSQVGYHPDQKKIACIELDARDTDRPVAKLVKITSSGPLEICSAAPCEWGDFLRYHYLKFDFSSVREEGLYQVVYGSEKSAIFRVSEDVYDRGVWQPVLEYFLPVQMCHMRVQEKYRVWHGHCHKDDAKMAPISRGHFDGYAQGPSTLTKYLSGDRIPGLNVGGWHDAGDFDLRIESQSGECYYLALAYEEFGVDYDATTIDQERHLVEIHQPDGKNDILQQIEHGALSVVAGYNAMGRLYRGIICNNLRQYVLQGDAAAMTDGEPGDDDRWVFTENNPERELETASHLAAVARVMKGFNDKLAEDSLTAAKNLFDITETGDNVRAINGKIHAASELFITTRDEKYKKFIIESKDHILKNASQIGWMGARVVDLLEDSDFKESLRDAMVIAEREIASASNENPYGIPYKPIIYGAGWNIQHLTFRYYFARKAFPEIFAGELLDNALNFILGCHPGLNTASFASGIGARSMTTAYGINRADWSYIPGGVVSGTALIQPDFPELLDFPFLWQQAEYVLGGGSSQFMFLVLAVRQLHGR